MNKLFEKSYIDKMKLKKILLLKQLTNCFSNMDIIMLQSTIFVKNVKSQNQLFIPI